MSSLPLPRLPPLPKVGAYPPLRVARICGAAAPGTLLNSPDGHGQTIGNNGNSGNQGIIR